MNNTLFIKDINTSNVPFFSKLVTIVLLLDSVLSIYGTEATSVSAIVQAVCVIVYVLFYAPRKKISSQIGSLPRWLIWYFLYLIAISAATGSFPLGNIKILLWYIVFFNVIDIRFLLKSYQTLAVFIIGFFYIQELTFWTTGFRVLGFIPGMPIRLIAAEGDVQGYLSEVATNSRSFSIFSEPAHLAQWLFPLLCIRLFSPKYRSLWRTLLIAITLLLTKSGNAMFGLGAVGAFYIFNNLLRSGSLTSKIHSLLIVVVCTFSVFFFLNSSLGEEVLDRKETLSVTNEMDKGYATSSFMRVFRGYFIYADYSTREKIFGNPSDDAFWQHASKSGISALFKEHDTYLNTVHRILIYTGLIGVFLIIMFIANLWRDNTTSARALLFVWIVFSFISSGFFTGYTSIYLAFVYFMKKQSIMSQRSQLLRKGVRKIDEAIPVGLNV